MKKANIGPEMIAMILLALVFFGVAATLIKKIDQGSTKAYDKVLCKQSVLLNSKARIPVLNQQEFSLACQTRYVTFEKDKIKTESKNFKDEKKIKCGDISKEEGQKCILQEANKVIANLLFDCWDQFAAGRVGVLNAWDANRQCVLCSRFEFSEDLKKAFQFSTNGLPLELSKFSNPGNVKEDYTLKNYLLSHNPSLHKITYYEFLLDPIDAYRQPTYDYSLNQPYAIVFKAMNEQQIGKDAWKFLKSHKLTIPGTNQNINPIYTTKGQKLETPEFVNIIDMIPYAEVAKECNSLE